jgi:hypothetical protein
LNEGGGEREATFTEFQKIFFLFFHFLIYGSKYACSKTKQLKLFNIFCSKNYSHHNRFVYFKVLQITTPFMVSFLESEKWLNLAKFWYVFEM